MQDSCTEGSHYFGHCASIIKGTAPVLRRAHHLMKCSSKRVRRQRNKVSLQWLGWDDTTDGARTGTQKSLSMLPLLLIMFPGWIVILNVCETSACIKEQIINKLQFSAFLFCQKHCFRTKEEGQKDLLSNIPRAVYISWENNEASSSYLVSEKLSAPVRWCMHPAWEMLCWEDGGAQRGSWQGTRGGMKDSGCPSSLAGVWTLSLLFLKLREERATLWEVKCLSFP